MSVTNVGAKLPTTRLLGYDPQQNQNRVAVSEENMKITAQRIKVVAAPMSSAEQQARLDTQAAMDKGFVESQIRPMFEKKSSSEAELDEIASNTSLTNEEKASRTSELKDKIKVYDYWLDSFKNMPAYKLFVMENSLLGNNRD